LKAKNYREIKGMPYSRAEYMRGVPHLRIAKFSAGTPRSDYNAELALIAEENAQIRDQALEAARVAANKALQQRIGEINYFLELKPYPHVILRENKMLATAGADRLQKGMQKAFGKVVGRAARVLAGSEVFTLKTMKAYVSEAEKALYIAAKKLPIPTRVVIKTNA